MPIQPHSQIMTLSTSFFCPKQWGSENWTFENQNYSKTGCFEGRFNYSKTGQFDQFSNLKPFENQTKIFVFWMAFENQTINNPTLFQPFENRTCPVFGSPLYFTPFFVFPAIWQFNCSSIFCHILMLLNFWRQHFKLKFCQ